MFTKTLLGFATCALAIAGAAETHRLTLYSPTMVNGTELKPGDYKLEIDGGKAVIKRGKDSVESAVRLENGDKKFGSTTVRYDGADGRYKLSEIRLGGTKTKVVFETPTAGAQ